MTIPPARDRSELASLGELRTWQSRAHHDFILAEHLVSTSVVTSHPEALPPVPKLRQSNHLRPAAFLLAATRPVGTRCKAIKIPPTGRTDRLKNMDTNNPPSLRTPRIVTQRHDIISSQYQRLAPRCSLSGSLLVRTMVLWRAPCADCHAPSPPQPFASRRYQNGWALVVDISACSSGHGQAQPQRRRGRPAGFWS